MVTYKGPILDKS